MTKAEIEAEIKAQELQTEVEDREVFNLLHIRNKRIERIKELKRELRDAV